MIDQKRYSGEITRLLRQESLTDCARSTCFSTVQVVEGHNGKKIEQINAITELVLEMISIDSNLVQMRHIVSGLGPTEV